MKCRHCFKKLKHTFLDLGFAPPSNAYLNIKDLNTPELYFPLRIKVCNNCWLVQTDDYTDAKNLFTNEYAYFSSISSSWLTHAKDYASKIIDALKLDNKSYVIEIASNDGYLLKNFNEADIPCLGIEPTKNTAIAAENLGIPVIKKFFGETLGKKLASKKKADLIIANNVYAHVPDINDFTKGLKAVLKPNGVITLEFPHLMSLIEQTLFDTIYHEHFSYLSLNVVKRIFNVTGLRIWHVEKLETHGGSLRVYGCHKNDKRVTQKSVKRVLNEEIKKGVKKLKTYLNFNIPVEKIKYDLISFLIEKKRSGNKVVAFGAAAKGNTLLNYAGVTKDLIPSVYDGAKSKQGKFMPGSHIPILPSKDIHKARPDYVLILPWNIAEEIKLQNISLSRTGTKFVTAVPNLKIL